MLSGMPVTKGVSSTAPLQSRLCRISLSGWICMAGGLSVSQAQIPANLTLPSTTITSGSATYEAGSSLAATSGFTVNGTGSVTFQAGSTITLGPGFTALATGTQPAFVAVIANAASQANFSFSLPAAQAVALGVRTQVQGTITPASGFTGPVTPIVTSALPAGVTVTFNPAVVQVTGTSSVNFTMSINAGPGATVSSVPVNLIVTAEGTPATWATVAVTITTPPLPVLTLTQPTPGTVAAPTLVWGSELLRGYALEPAPLLPSDLITGVNVSIVRDDDTTYSVSGAATYGNPAVPRYDACGGNGITGLYPGSPGCPNVDFDYTWNTGTFPVTGAFMPNAIYTATFTASGSSSPPLSNSISATFAVDNQTPAPAIVGPINSSGAFGVEQQIVITYNSPHSNLDFGYGQIMFQSPSQTCVVQWSLPSTIAVVGTAPPCTVDSGTSSLTNNGTNEVTVQLGITFASSMSGQTVVSAFGTNSIGEVGPWSAITDFTVTGSAPQILTYTESVVVEPNVTTSICAPVILTNGARSPVTIAQVSVVPSLQGFSVNVVANGSSPPIPCAAGSVLISANASVTGNPTVYTITYELTDASGLATANGWIDLWTYNGPQFNISTASQNYTAGQGTSITVPVTVTSQGGSAGSVNVTTQASNQYGPSISPASSPGSVASNGSWTTNLTVSVAPTVAPGEYHMYVIEAGPAGSWPSTAQFWVNVTSNVAPDYNIGAITPESIQAGQSISFTGEIIPVPFSGYSGTVKLTGLAPGDAPGISLPDSVSIVSGPQSFTGTITSLASTVTCTYTLPVSAISGSLQHSGSVAVSVQGGGAPFAKPAWGSIGVTQGASSSLAVTATASSCFSGAASFAASGFPSGVTFTFPTTPPTVTGPVLAISPVSAGTITVNAAANVTPGTYSGILTVTLGGAAYSNTLAVTVSPAATAPAPSYTISCTNCPPQSQGGFILTPGVPVTALIAITRQNGYANNPVLYPPTDVPAGVTVSYDNNATESAATQNVVAATFTASATAPAMAESYVWVTSWDSALQATMGLPIYLTVNGTAVVAPPPPIAPAPLSVGTSVYYTNVNPATKTPTVAILTVTPAGGTQPYHSALSNDISWGPVQQVTSLEYSISGFTSNRHATLTVTDSSSPPQTFVTNVFVPAPQPYPDAYLHAAVLDRISAVEQLAGSLIAQGADPSGVRSTIQRQLGIGSTQYGSLVTLASQLQAGHLSNAAAARSAINSLHSSGLTVENATPAARSALDAAFTSDAALPATYQSSVAALLGGVASPEYVSFDGSALQLIGGDLDDCDQDFGCDPCDPTFEEGCPSESLIVYAFTSTQIAIDSATGQFTAFSDERIVTRGSPIESDTGVCVSVTVNPGTVYGNPQQPVCNNTAAHSISQVYGVATQAGLYTVTGVAQAFSGCLHAVGCDEIDVPALVSGNSTQFNPPSCSPPTIDSILVNSGNGPQPISELPIGSSGTISISGACLDSTSQVSIGFDSNGDSAGSPTGVSVVSFVPWGWGGLTIQFSVAAGTMPETVVLTVSTSSGSASTNLDVVTSGPYIDLIDPQAWPEASPATTVTISGSGFGAFPGSIALSVTPGGQSDVSLVGIQSWADNMIVVTVATAQNSAGDTVTVAVTGGVAYGFATGFQQGKGPGTGQTATGNAVIAGNKCPDPFLNQLIAEYSNPANRVLLRPSCADFLAIVAVANPDNTTISVPNTTTVVPNTDLNWGEYNWAIIQSRLNSGLNLIAAATGNPYPMGIASAYRNPAREQVKSPGTTDSRHVYGDAVDFQVPKTKTRGLTQWQSLFNFLNLLTGYPGVTCIEPFRFSGASHVHIEWRPSGSSCTDPTWNQDPKRTQ
jgi:hypothetical protein